MKEKVERCHLWWCFKKSTGAMEISVDGKVIVRTPYCEKHGKIAEEIIKERDFKSFYILLVTSSEEQVFVEC